MRCGWVQETPEHAANSTADMDPITYRTCLALLMRADIGHLLSLSSTDGVGGPEAEL
jgi:hypothetical protein